MDNNTAIKDVIDENKLDGDFSIEDAFVRLAEINQQLESAGVSLKESLALYSEGVRLVSKCKEHLTEVEKEIQVLNHV